MPLELFLPNPSLSMTSSAQRILVRSLGGSPRKRSVPTVRLLGNGGPCNVWVELPRNAVAVVERWARLEDEGSAIVIDDVM